MSARAIFGLQVLLSLVGYSLIARFYVVRAERGPRTTRMIAPGMGQ